MNYLKFVIFYFATILFRAVLEGILNSLKGKVVVSSYIDQGIVKVDPTLVLDGPVMCVPRGPNCYVTTGAFGCV